MRESITKPRSCFLEVRCEDCGNTQIIFNKPSTVVRCLVCNTELTEPAGGVAKFLGTVLGEVW
ncbi:MAG: 30S ribosomal protein S27e [Candidatus Heimdallarchaeota archaeon]